MQNTAGRERERREKISAVSSKGRKKSSKTDGSRWLLFFLNDRHQSSSSFYDDDASTDAGTHPHIETVSKPNDKKNGFERIRSARFARVESAKRVARGPVGAMILRVFFLFFLAGNRPTTRSRVRCVWSRARKKNAGKTRRFRASRNRGKETERLFREREKERERERVRVPLFVMCVLISDGFWWR